MEQLQYSSQLNGTGHDQSDDALVRVAVRLILSHQRQDGSVAIQGLARQLTAAAEACNVQLPVLLRVVVAQLPPQAARRLTNAVPPASTAPRAPWRRKGCVYRAVDALPPMRWVRYRLNRSRYEWVRQRAAARQGLAAFTTIERAADAAVARFASVVSLPCFAQRFSQEPDFRAATVQLVCELAAPELHNPSGAEQRLNMIALSDLSAWLLRVQQPDAPAEHQLGAELVMLAIPTSAFDQVTTQIRALMQAEATQA